MIGLADPQAAQTGDGGTRSPLAEVVATMFAPSGLVCAHGNLEHRPQQAAMAHAVASAFRDNASLLVEAGTGVGKSLAYLLPAILHATASDRPCVLSTHTISLQEQIVDKDLHLVREILRRQPALAPAAMFKHALLVGRGNYLCGTRLAHALETRNDLFDSTAMRDLERITQWASITQHGLLGELSPPPAPDVWDWVNADGSSCNSRNCSVDNCYYRKARAALAGARLIIVNHSLLLALLAGGHHPSAAKPGVLFPNDFLVVDEAHRLPDVATDHFGQHISSFGLRRQLLRLHNSKRRKAQGILSRLGNMRLCTMVDEALYEADHFFGEIHGRLLINSSICRLREPQWIGRNLSENLDALARALATTEKQLPEGPQRDELAGMVKYLKGFVAGVDECIDLADTESVYWVERGGRRETIVVLRSAPIDVAPLIRTRFFERHTGVVLTSATLAEGRSMASFQRKSGSSDVTAMIEDSPFDYRRNMQIRIASDAPEPRARQAARLDTAYLADVIRQAISWVSGGTLVLFTSYQDMRAVDAVLRPHCASIGRPYAMQGVDGSRSELTERMRRAGNQVLLGTDSFWTGVDVPGSALEQVIITRLPFDNPGHPVSEARAEHCLQHGGNPFADLTLPAALIKFRQGLGRLIRSTRDRGILTILDSRILTKPYGRLFIEVLPHANFVRFTVNDRFAD
jgi:ATP-dependent DNA helicase DinG